MSERFTGRVDIEDSAAQPRVRITFSGDQGTAQFRGDRSDSPSTTLTNGIITIGKKPAAPGTPSPDGGAGASTTDETVDVTQRPKTFVSIGDQTLPGGLFIVDGKGRQVFNFNGVTAALRIGGEGNPGDVLLVDGKNEVRLRLNGSTGDIELTGADCAEEFDVVDGVISAEPGTVVSIGDCAGVQPSDVAYDRRVAGIVSGAGGYRPGIVLDRTRCERRRVPLALSGKAFCKVDAGYGSVDIGDLLTTSPTSGFAMKATDPLRAFGAVIGKALHPLPSGRGLIPVLVCLQ